MPATDESAKTTTYRGNCHCGAFVFEARIPEVEFVVECDCSNCLKKGYLWLFLDSKDVTIVENDGLLTEFTCGPMRSTHQVCPFSGVNEVSRAHCVSDAILMSLVL